jgi:hypothetical protein
MFLDLLGVFAEFETAILARNGSLRGSPRQRLRASMPAKDGRGR